jgi:hypothetical protein
MSDVIRWDEWDQGFNPAAIGMRCNIEQYRLLKTCSEGKDISEWNNWREEHPGDEILLCGANLDGAHLDGSKLGRAHLEGARLVAVRLAESTLTGAQLDGACLIAATLKSASLIEAHLTEANLIHASLSGAHILGADLRGTRGLGAFVDASTEIWQCHVDKDTFFAGVGLGAASVEPGLRQLLEYNVRRHRWLDWFRRNQDGVLVRAVRFVLRKPQREGRELALDTRNKRTKWTGGLSRSVVGCASERLELELPPLHEQEYNWTDWYDVLVGGWSLSLLKRLFVWPFWWISDYGRSTWRILVTFLVLAIVFGLHYWGNTACLRGFEDVPASSFGWRELAYALYFSIVTMTTLGFGDVHANPASVWGQVILSVQVILGYVLLGALVTRFAVLFSGGGPAAKVSRGLKKSRKDRDSAASQK